MTPLVLKFEGDRLDVVSRFKGKPVRFMHFGTDNFLPLHGVVTQLWFDQASIMAFPGLRCRLFFLQKRGGNPCWHWIRLHELAIVASRLTLDTKELFQWNVEFTSVEEEGVKDFAPVLFVVVHV